ncbi:hypothetical protein B0H14DRAFT_3439044 [Mycena olivaceomarginata]|nr:hypothetical protein B0H14DRAFT_3439044 [Mycena olivaceomarginata]
MDGPQKRKKHQGRRSDNPAAKAARCEADRNYRWKNEEELREKARVRMAARRAAIKEEGQSEEYAAGVKKAHATYRAKQSKLLAFKQRLRRQKAFIAKYGQQAYLNRIAAERARDDAAWAAKLAEEEKKREAERNARREARQRESEGQSRSATLGLNPLLISYDQPTSLNGFAVHVCDTWVVLKEFATTLVRHMKLWDYPARGLAGWAVGSLPTPAAPEDHNLNTVSKGSLAWVSQFVTVLVTEVSQIHMSNDYCPCKPPYRPSAGHEDVQEHSATAGRVFYTVGVGFVRGIYTDEYIARQQVTRYSDGKWKKSATYKEAVAIWNQMCEHYHHHEEDQYSESSPPTSPPPPSPSPSPAPHTPVRSFAPPAIRVAHQASLPLSPRSTIPEAVYIRGSPRPSSSKSVGRRGSVGDPVASSSRHRQSSTPPLQVQPRRTGSEWREGETLWGIEGVPLLFEDRYDAVDHISAKQLSPARIMETCNHRKLEAFVEKRRYVRKGGDPEDSE